MTSEGPLDEGTLIQTMGELEVSREHSQGESSGGEAKEPPSLAGFELSYCLGEGSFGEVWAGLQSRTGQEVAVKVIRRRGYEGWDSFVREVEKLREVAKHPYVVSLLDADLEHDPPYIVMPKLQGSLSQFVDGPEKPSVKQVAMWLEQMAEGLRYTHEKGILHCDIKPSNVLLDEDGRARLVDFGQAVTEGDQSGNYGTLGYMPPEQVEPGASPSPSWDIYALGATTYNLLTGRAPRLEPEHWSSLSECEDIKERLLLHQNQLRTTKLTWIDDINPWVDEDLSSIVMRCLTPSAEHRSASAAYLLEELERRSQGQPVLSAKPWRMSYRFGKWAARNRLVLLFLVLYMIFLGTPMAWLATDPLPPIELKTLPDYVEPLGVREWDGVTLGFSLEDFGKKVFDHNVDAERYYREELQRMMLGAETQIEDSSGVSEYFEEHVDSVHRQLSRESKGVDTALSYKSRNEAADQTLSMRLLSQYFDSRGEQTKAFSLEISYLILGIRAQRGNEFWSDHRERRYLLETLPLVRLSRRDLSRVSTGALRSALTRLNREAPGQARAE